MGTLKTCIRKYTVSQAILLLLFLSLLISGCGDRESSGKPKVAVSTKTEKHLSQEEQFAQTKLKAEAGDAKEQLNLVVMYYEGDGVPQDKAKAVEWLLKAATQGDAASQYFLGLGYYQGDIVPQDKSKAIEWWKKSAAKGYADAQYKLGSLYLDGEGVSKDISQTIELWQKSAAQGNTEAQFSLFHLYYLSGAVPKDTVKAVEWLQKAAIKGNAEAQYQLSWMYGHGEGVPKSDAKEFEWLQKVAAQGKATAQSDIAMRYEKGIGVRKDLVLAYAWANLAAAQGNNLAKTLREEYETILSSEQREEGQRLATNWKKGDILGFSSSKSVGPSPDGKLRKQATGTAFVISQNGYALTNHHVIDGCAEVKIKGHEGVAKVVNSDRVSDLALLQLAEKFTDIAYINPDPTQLSQGDNIIVFGYPLNSLLSSSGNLTPGTVSALSGLGNNINQIQITAPIQPGSSGSPVLISMPKWSQ